MGTPKNRRPTKLTYAEAYDLMPPSTVPEAERNGVQVKRFEVSRDAAMRFNLKQMMNAARCNSDRTIQPGVYTRMVEGGHVLWMSDTPAEMRDHVPFLKIAYGSVLVYGLGLGVVAEALLNHPSVTDVTVVEQNPDVIALVEPSLRKHRNADRLTIVHGDAYEWTPPEGKKFSAVWADIWPTICESNLEGIETLRGHSRNFGKNFRAWCESESRAMARSEARW